jgi:2-dehydropantoate 2-reductase
MSPRILVVGAGAVGGYFGARLAAAGRDVTFLVRAGRAEQLRRDGLRVSSPHGGLELAPKLVLAEDLAAPYDFVFVSVKGYALDSAMADFAGAVGPNTIILPLLNGMRHMDRLTRRFGPAPIIGGVCLVAAEVDPDGRIVQLAEMQQLSYGERDGTVSARLQTLDAALQGAGFTAQLSAGIEQAMWEKWVMLASLGAATCLLRGPIGKIVAAPGGAAVSRAILDECAAVAAGCGHPPSAPFLARHAAAMTAAGSPMTSSMYRDLRKGAPVEADEIVGDLVERGRAAGIATPLLAAAFVNLSVYGADRG